MRDAALAYARQHRQDHLHALDEFLRIPSISTLPEHQADVQRAALWLAEYLRRMGMAQVQVLPTGLHPIVYGEYMHAGDDAPTLLAYGHYDVQPVDPLEEWRSPPFEPTVRGDDLFARGACDDKGQTMAMLAAAEAYLRTGGRLPVNLKLILEGEEEVGSPSMSGFIAEHHERLAADAVLICDTEMPDPNTPAITYGIRGIASLELEVSGPTHDLHSGMAGGAVDNPLNVLVYLLSRLHDPATGLVAIPGFYDRVRPITEAERKLLAGGPLTDEVMLQLTGVPALTGEKGYSVAERTTVRPTLDIHGIIGGFVGPGLKTVIPASVTAKVSMRLVPDQDPDEVGQLFAAYMRSLAPPTVKVETHLHGGSRAAVSDYQAPAVKAAAQALELTWGVPPIYVRIGGTIPLIPDLQKAFAVPVVMFGFGLPDDNLHAPNEKFHLPNYYRGIEALIHYFATLASQSAKEAA